MSLTISLTIGLFVFSQAEASHFTIGENTEDRVIINEVNMPLIIENARANLNCQYLKGNRNSFKPFDEITLSFAAKNPIPVALKNSSRLLLWGQDYGLNISADNPDIKVEPADCEILLARAKNLINSKDQIVLSGNHRIIFAYGRVLVEEHAATLDLGKPLHGNNPNLMKFKLGSSVYIELAKAVPLSLEQFSELTGTKEGKSRLHPRAAGSVGLNCVSSSNFFDSNWKTLRMGQYPKGLAQIESVDAAESFFVMNSDECEKKRIEMFKESEKVDPQNTGEFVAVQESMKWDPEFRNLQIIHRFTYQNLEFKRELVIDL
jgi:hypothetical protein